MKDQGNPYTGGVFRKWCAAAGSAAGRHTGSVNLAEVQGSLHKIERNWERYTRAARQKKLADSAMEKRGVIHRPPTLHPLPK